MPQGEDDRLIALVAAALAAETSGQVAVAVSGGSDSVGLLHMMHKVALGAGQSLYGVTVDHGLRADSATEAAHVGDLCRSLGVGHEVLIWDHGTIAGNIMQQARQARYALIANWAAERGIACVAVGHTADDQAETFLMELARGAGLDGLSGMRARWSEHGIRWIRPLLGVERSRLRAYLARQGLGWIDDPSNHDDRYLRIRARTALRALAPLGISAAKLGTVAANLASARSALDEVMAETAGRIVRERAGALWIDRSGLARSPAEIRRRLLIAALRWTSGSYYAPRAASVRRLEQAVADGRDATLAGCRVRNAADDTVLIVREPSTVAGVVAASHALWDGRWKITPERERSGQQPADAIEVRALGSAGLRSCSDWRNTGLPRDALIVSPAVWSGDTLLNAPLAGFGRGWAAQIVTPFTAFLVSH